MARRFNSDDGLRKIIQQSSEALDIFEALLLHFDEELKTTWLEESSDAAWIEIADEAKRLFEVAIGDTIEKDSLLDFFFANIAIAAQKYGAQSGKKD